MYTDMKKYLITPCFSNSSGFVVGTSSYVLGSISSVLLKMVAACSLNRVSSSSTCCSSFGDDCFPATLTEALELVLLT